MNTPDSPKNKLQIIGSLIQHPFTLTPEVQSDILDCADILEIRYDHYPEVSIKEVRNVFSIPLLLTIRTPSNHGAFKGTHQEKMNILQQAVQDGFEYIDCEYDFPEVRELYRTYANKLVVSYHNFQETPRNLHEIINSLCIHFPEAVKKVVTTAAHYQDILYIKNILSEYSGEIVLFAMGPYGGVSRIMAGAWGSRWTFGSIHANQAAAPGQIAIQDLASVYQVKQLTQDTSIYALLGNPVQQSIGKYIHNQVFQATRKNAVYIDFLTENLDTELSAIQKMVSGASITMPWKEKIRTYYSTQSSIPINDKKLTPFSLDTIAAINTLKIVTENESHTMVALCNTDMQAILSLIFQSLSLSDSTKDLSHTTFLILGSGGFAATAIQALISVGANLILWARNTNNLQSMYEMALQTKHSFITTHNIQDMTIECLPSLDAIQQYSNHPTTLTGIIQGTSVGFNSPHESIFPYEWIDSSWLLFESVAHPVETQLVKSAQKKSCKLITGMDLFIKQAELQYEFWFSEKVDSHLYRSLKK